MDRQTMDAILWLEGIVTHCDMTGKTFSETLEGYGRESESHRKDAERISLEAIRTLICKILSCDDSAAKIHPTIEQFAQKNFRDYSSQDKSEGRS